MGAEVRVAGATRPAWLGDLVASLFVGCGLWCVWREHHGLSAAAIATGYVPPLIVYRFSTYWNRRPFCRRRAVRLMLLMGTIFLLVHVRGVPPSVRTLTGFVAPLFVSWRARVVAA